MLDFRVRELPCARKCVPPRSPVVTRDHQTDWPGCRPLGAGRRHAGRLGAV